MPGKIWDVEWFNQNAQRNYPLVDDATRLDKSGSFTLPNDFIVDFRLVVHALNIDPSRFFVGSVSAFSHGFVLTINYDTGSKIEVVGSVSILTATHTVNTSYSITSASNSDLFLDAMGTITIGNLTTMQQHGGAYTFDLAATRLNPAAIVPDIRALTGIRVQNAGGDPSELIQGDVILRAGNNIQLSAETTTPEGGGPAQVIIYISATGNDNYVGDCDCSGNPLGQCITKINGVSPNANGEIFFRPDPESGCLNITAGEAANTLEFKDTCCAPCCGCEELEVLTSEIKTMRNQLRDLEAYASTLEQAMTQLQIAMASLDTGDLQ